MDVICTAKTGVVGIERAGGKKGFGFEMGGWGRWK
jgi:hypothetical protein